MAASAVDAINFACQRCCQPLKIVSSADDPNSANDVASHLKAVHSDDILTDLTAQLTKLKSQEKESLKMSESETNGEWLSVAIE